MGLPIHCRYMVPRHQVDIDVQFPFELVPHEYVELDMLVHAVGLHPFSIRRIPHFLSTLLRFHQKDVRILSVLSLKLIFHCHLNVFDFLLQLLDPLFRILHREFVLLVFVNPLSGLFHRHFVVQTNLHRFLWLILHNFASEPQFHSNVMLIVNLKYQFQIPVENLFLILNRNY